MGAITAVAATATSRRARRGEPTGMREAICDSGRDESPVVMFE
jgi:hypothetical protein